MNSTTEQFRNGSRLKRRTQRAKRKTAAILSFPCKLRYAFVTMKILRGRRLTHRMGSTADLEYTSQGCPASGRKARLASRTHWGCPRRGRDGREGSPQREASLLTSMFLATPQNRCKRLYLVAISSFCHQITVVARRCNKLRCNKLLQPFPDWCCE